MLLKLYMTVIFFSDVLNKVYACVLFSAIFLLDMSTRSIVPYLFAMGRLKKLNFLPYILF